MRKESKFFCVFYVFLTTLLAAESLQCSSNVNCRCHEFQGKLFANCENLNLKSAPLFSDDVVGINLANNVISIFPSNLPKHIVHLDISKNKLRKIENTSLANFSALHNLSIANNNLHTVELYSLRKLSNLQRLDISGNQELTLEVLFNISRDLQNSSTIRYLNFENLQCTYGVSFIIKKYHIAYLKHTHLEELNIASNRISRLEFGVLTELPRSLKHLNLANNILSFGFYIVEFGDLENVVSLNISFQAFFHQIYTKQFFIQCNDTRPDLQTESHSELPMLSTASLSTFRGTQNISIFIPPKLERFYSHDNLYKVVLQDYVFKTVSKPVLTHIFMQNSFVYRLNGPLKGIESVIYANFSNNFCSYISPRFFEDFPNLSQLDLSHNALGEHLESDHQGEIFQKLFRLTSLNLSRNRIVLLPDNIFRNLNLLKTLNLRYNSLSEFSLPLKHMTKLAQLDLSYNQLLVLEEETRHALDSISKQRKINVNLLGNRFKCDCENLKFIKWMHNSKGINFVSFGNYTCTFSNSSQRSTQISFTKIEDLLQGLEKQCSSYTLVILLMTSLIIVVMTTVLSRIVYRYRWKLRFMYYVAREKYRDNVQRIDVIGDSSYYFDAFVSYADKDRRLVIDLVKQLEEESKLKLCIHHRDFIPGTDIADNITNAIHCSRRTICVITSHFIDSYWCMFELNMARMEAVYSRNSENVLFLVVLEKGAVNKLPRSFMDLIKTKSYLDFPEGGDSDEVSAFRSKLGDTLNSPNGDFKELHRNI
ncbi:toll-like receptor 4 [Ostrea edulis]|uniref:toll-like receptor 4 n=1 Tax=Ostrea edulis TaxID=37623 RepID=UPI0024AF4F5F|nr:toll-like receptor 4 [Ostrea edulis]